MNTVRLYRGRDLLLVVICSDSAKTDKVMQGVELLDIVNIVHDIDCTAWPVNAPLVGYTSTVVSMRNGDVNGL